MTTSQPSHPTDTPDTPDGWEVLFQAETHTVLNSLAAQTAVGATPFELDKWLRTDNTHPSDPGSSGEPGEPHDPEHPPATGQRFTAAQRAALLTQVELRNRARSKFGQHAERMLFTQAGLEQASRYPVAQLHASRFLAAGCHTVADLGCGIGTEAMALHEAGLQVIAADIDPFTARIARHNLAQLDAHRSTVTATDAAELLGAANPNFDAIFFDPARRTAGHTHTRRLTSTADYSPSLELIFDAAERFPLGVKLGPGFPRQDIPATAEAQWVSVNGQLVETTLWFGALRRPGIHRSAYLLPGGHELSAAADALDAEQRKLGEFLYEPDGAVIRARLIGDLAQQLHAGMISEGIAYLTSDHAIHTPFAQGFQILAQLPANEKQLRRELAKQDIGILEIKKRGADIDPAALRKRLQLSGTRAATLFLTRIAGRHTALLAKRL